MNVELTPKQILQLIKLAIENREYYTAIKIIDKCLEQVDSYTQFHSETKEDVASSKSK